MLDVDALFGGRASVAHGNACVSLTLTGNRPGAVVLSPDAARELAVMLHEQADYADTGPMPVEDTPPLPPASSTVPKRLRALLEPVGASKGAYDCPRTLEGVRCLHGIQRDEFGKLVDDHMHLGYDEQGNRVEWITALQRPRFRSPRYSHWGMMIDALTALLLAGLALVHVGIAVYADHTYAVWQRVFFGIVGALLGIAFARFATHMVYIDQQAGPDKFDGSTSWGWDA